MATSKKSTGTTSNDPTLFAVDTPVSPSAKQDDDKAQMTQDTYSHGFSKPLADYDPDTQSWRMFGDTFLWGELPLLQALPVSGMTRNGVLYQLPAWALRTDEIDCLLFPTPTAVMRPMEGNVRLYRAHVEAGLMTEEEANAILGKSVWEAQGKLPAKYPTMSANGMGNTGSQMMLQKLVDEGSLTAEEKKAMTAGNGGRLNPEWIEWLMGFPTGWTDLED